MKTWEKFLKKKTKNGENTQLSFIYPNAKMLKIPDYNNTMIIVRESGGIRGIDRKMLNIFI